MVFYISKVHIGYTMKQLCKAFISLCNCRTELIAVHIEIIKQSCKATFRGRTFCRCFDMVEYAFQGFIQIFIIVCFTVNITKQLRWRNEKAFFLNQSLTSFLCINIGHFCIVKIRISSFLFSGIDIICQVFRNVAIKHGTKDIVFEVPTVHGSTKFISDCPYRTVQFVTLLFFFCVNHCFFSPFRRG